MPGETGKTPPPPQEFVEALVEKNVKQECGGLCSERTSTVKGVRVQVIQKKANIDDGCQHLSDEAFRNGVGEELKKRYETIERSACADPNCSCVWVTDTTETKTVGPVRKTTTVKKQLSFLFDAWVD